MRYVAYHQHNIFIMSTITELNSTTASTFAEGRALDECVGGVDKNAIAETKQEKKLAAAAK